MAPELPQKTTKKNGFLAWLVLAAAALAVVTPFLWLGIPSGHDFEFHLNSWMEVQQQWKTGILYPRWADLAHFGYGEARFVFYPPASWMLGAALGSVLPWKLAPAAYIWIALTLSGCSMFLLARRWLERRDALFAAVLYVVNPYYLVIVYWRSAYAELLAGAFLPLLLLLVLRLEEERWRGVIGLGLVVAGVWVSDAPAAVIATYSLVLLLVLVAARGRSARVLAYGGVALAIGLGLAAFYVLPAAYEEKWVSIGQVLSEGVRPQDNFLFHQLNDADHNRFNLLVSLVAVGEILVVAMALFFAGRRRDLPKISLPLAAWAGAATLLMFPFSLVAWTYLPELRFVQLPWRWLLGLNVALAFFVVAAWRRGWQRCLVYAALMAVVVFVWHRVQAPWWDNAAAVAQMDHEIQSQHGYEGTDEYVPVAGDPYEVDQQARRVMLDGPGRADIRVLQWGAESKRFDAHVSEATELKLRLFNYPAWRVEVNGQAVLAETSDVTGQVVVPVQAGDNRVRLSFERTWDRTVGAGISAVTLVLLFLLGFLGRGLRRA
jgi:6-pyruvoyl-tetrahydropterin synthase related domain